VPTIARDFGRIPDRVTIADTADRTEPGPVHRQHRHTERTMFPPAQLLDPLRLVHGIRSDRYDCPDLAALDQHINRLRRRITRLDGHMPGVADDYRADIDRLLDRRSWLTLPVALDELEQPAVR
jgi:hypothetical protein